MSKKKRTIIRQPRIGTPGMRMIILAFLVLLIFVADVLLIFDHGKTFSENENRVLQQAPALTANSLSTGSFMSDEEDFVTDQFFLRDAWISLKLSVDKLMGKVESNDVYLGKDNYLLEKPVEPTAEYLQRNLDAINQFADTYYDLNVVMTLIPGAAWICDQLRPNNAPIVNVEAILGNIKAKLNQSVNFVDVSGVLREHKKEDLYYKSDHHWKSLGAFYAFEAMTTALGIDDPVSDYAILDVTHSFSGTMASNSGATYVKDSIQLYVPITGAAAGQTYASEAEKALATNLQYVVEYVDSTKKSATIYDSSALEEKDKYQVFLGGNHSLINIQTNVDNGRSLLVLKDSYANTFLQFLLPYYNLITVVDPRYYSDNLEKLLADNHVTDVLILYSENNFVTDNSLFGVLEDLFEE